MLCTQLKHIHRQLATYLILSGIDCRILWISEVQFVQWRKLCNIVWFYRYMMVSYHLWQNYGSESA